MRCGQTAAALCVGLLAAAAVPIGAQHEPAGSLQQLTVPDGKLAPGCRLSPPHSEGGEARQVRANEPRRSVDPGSLSVTDGAQEPSRTRISAAMAHTNRVLPEQRKPSLRSAFRSELEDIRVTIARLAAQLTEDTMRATDVLLRQDVFTAGR